MINNTPPPIVSRYQYQNCKQINDPITKKRVYHTPDGEKLPSVTTILSATKDMTHLIAWKKRVGPEKAQQITTEAAGRGTSMHQNLENYITGTVRQQGSNLVHTVSNKMADTIIEHGLCNVNEIWAMEQSLYYPGLYSGTTDLVGVHNGNQAIMDYKQSNRPKKSEYVDDYRMQLCAYAAAHNVVYGTSIRKGVIFMAVKPEINQASGDIGHCQYQEFTIEGDEFDDWTTRWFDKVEEYYNIIN
jgi:genome maintenance exonuclease 1